MLQESDVLKNVIKPLIYGGSIIKVGSTTRKNNFKYDNYTVLEHEL